MTALPPEKTVGVIGAGTMGAGIAQVAAAAGHPVLLFDAADGAAQKGRNRLESGLARRVERGKLRQSEADGLLGRIRAVPSIEDLRASALVIEAIVEDLHIKQSVFSQLESVVGPDAILATNTSSISVTAIGQALERPERLVGMHFFNPAPVMKLVEVVSGLATDPNVANAVHATAAAWGKVPANAKSTPGFIVNRVARPFYGEALRLYGEGVADPQTLDALYTGGGGFRMGPFALMDLIGHDVNYSVTESVFRAFSGDPRYRPSQIQAELIAAGWLGRKSGRGFFDYSEGAEPPAPRVETPGPDAGIPAEVLVRLTDGRTASRRSRDEGRPVIVHDLLRKDGGSSRIAFAASENAPEAAIAAFVRREAEAGRAATRIDDTPGLVVLRTVAMLANEGYDAVLQGVASAADVDSAMRYGVNYPKGPIAWAQEIGLDTVLSVLDALFDAYRDTRYRASLALRRAAGGM